MLDTLDDGLLGCRDRSLLLIGFAGGFRRSEIANLDAEDVNETADGLVIRVRRSKTDPEARGISVALPYGSAAATCPVRSYRSWIAAAGLDPAPDAGHSLRAGFATQAFLNGAAEVSIMRQTRHKSLNTLRKYIRDRSLFRDNPAAKLGL